MNLARSAGVSVLVRRRSPVTVAAVALVGLAGLPRRARCRRRRSPRRCGPRRARSWRRRDGRGRPSPSAPSACESPASSVPWVWPEANDGDSAIVENTPIATAEAPTPPKPSVGRSRCWASAGLIRMPAARSARSRPRSPTTGRRPAATGSGVHGSTLVGTPHTRDTNHTASTIVLPTTPSRSSRRVGRTITAAAQVTWAQPTTAKNSALEERLVEVRPGEREVDDAGAQRQGDQEPPQVPPNGPVVRRHVIPPDRSIADRVQSLTAAAARAGGDRGTATRSGGGRGSVTEVGDHLGAHAARWSA